MLSSRSFKTVMAGVATMATSTFAYSNGYDYTSYQDLSLASPCFVDGCSKNITLYSFDSSKTRLSLDNDNADLKLENNTGYKHLTISNEKDWDYLMGQTYTILGLSVATVGMMTFLPESITKWDEEDRDLSNLGNKWKDNVSAGPVWDRDEHYLNYVMHPYFGGVYYTAARHAGYNEFESFLYSATMSTFFWEYGVEAFAEVPSWQDLFITPFFGAVVGEMMLEAEQNILANGGKVADSQTLGDVSVFLLNPVGHIHYWVSDAWGGSAELQFSSSTWFGNSQAREFAIDSGAPYDSMFYGLQMKVYF